MHTVDESTRSGTASRQGLSVVDAPVPVPRFSVIIPLESHRGHAVRCVRGWAAEQVFPRDQFELVLACPPGHPPDELNEIRSLLGPQDRVLQFDHHHDMGLCVGAAEAARGDLLFFTESHCIPEPETLARTDAAARLNPEWAGFSCHSVPITDNLLSKIEAESYGRDIEFGMTEHPWRKVLDQCFVVQREAYFQAGGFDPAFGHFAEWLIAARLHALGLKIGYTPAARIHHVYIGQFGEWRRFTADFVEGQMKYLALEPADPLRTMFDEVPEWSRRHNLQRDVARRVCRMLVLDLRRSLVVGSPGRRLSLLRRWHWRLLTAWLSRAVGGSSKVLVQAHLQRLWFRLALRTDLLLRDQERAEKHLARCCEAIARLERVRFLGRWARDFRRDTTNRPLARRHEPKRRYLATRTTDRSSWRRIPPRLRRRGGGDSLVGARCLRRAPARRRRLQDRAELALPSGGARRIASPRLSRRTPSARARTFASCKTAPSSASRFRSRRPRPASAGSARAHHAPGDDRTLGLPVTSITWIRED